MNNKLLIIGSMMLVATSISCKKETIESPDEKLVLRNKLSYTPEDGPVRSGSGVPVEINANGDYVTGYGGGINFGSTFTHPTSVLFENNGAPWEPTISGATTTTNLISFVQEANHFTMILGTTIGGGNIPQNNLSAISDYNADFIKYVKGETTVMPELSSYMASYGGDGSGIVVIKGSFVIDTDSPTNVSITNLNLDYWGTIPVVL